MKERPILFSAPMVRALMREENPKTQTRRIMKFKPPFDWANWGEEARDAYCRRFSPYGKPGDRLWVRETWQPLWAKANKAPADFKSPDGWEIGYVATDGIQEYNDPDDNPTTRCKPAIHMPRWASRLTLDVTGVRVERLQDITEADAQAEGADYWVTGHGPVSTTDLQCEPGYWGQGSYKTGYWDLWESINGKGSWEANPWVWVVEFRRLP